MIHHLLFLGPAHPCSVSIIVRINRINQQYLLEGIPLIYIYIDVTRYNTTGLYPLLCVCSLWSLLTMLGSHIFFSSDFFAIFLAQIRNVNREICINSSNTPAPYLSKTHIPFYHTHPAANITHWSTWIFKKVQILPKWAMIQPWKLPFLGSGKDLFYHTVVELDPFSTHHPPKLLQFLFGKAGNGNHWEQLPWAAGHFSWWNGVYHGSISSQVGVWWFTTRLNTVDSSQHINLSPNVQSSMVSMLVSG